jgi:hypothetical protein
LMKSYNTFWVNKFSLRSFKSLINILFYRTSCVLSLWNMFCLVNEVHKVLKLEFERGEIWKLWKLFG